MPVVIVRGNNGQPRMFILVRLLCRRGRASQKLAHALRNPFDAAMIGICAAFRIGNALVNERKYPNIVELTVPAGTKRTSNHRPAMSAFAEAMMWDLQLMDLGDWHPREIPESLLKSEALQQQQVKTLPPMEQWYLMLLHDAKLPGATDDYPVFSKTRALIANAVNRVPRLRFELGDTELRDFLTDKERIGLVHTKDHIKTGNGWRFEPLSLCREAWERLYGPQKWETDTSEWGEAG